jgi:hypothetical protein
MRVRIAAVAAVAALAALSLTGCGDSSKKDSSATTAPVDTTASTDATASTAVGGKPSCAPPNQTSTVFTRPGGTTSTMSGAAVGNAQAHLTAVRVGHHDDAGGSFDRVAFEFEGGALPGYQVEYAERPITEDASGKDVAVKGGAVLRVRMEPASGADTASPTPPVRQTYTGPDRIAGPGAPVAEVVRSGDFESVLTWVIGTASENGFNAYAVEGNKLVIDVHC